MKFAGAFTAIVIALAMPQNAFAKGANIHGLVTGAQRNPVARATITLHEPAKERTATTQSDGTFTIEGSESGTYDVTVTAAGYAAAHRIVTIPQDGDVALSVVLQLATASSLTTISSITVGASANVSSASAPSRTIGRFDLANTSTGRLGDVLTGEAAIAPVRPAGGTGNAPLYVALRGPDPSETLIELDGHKINSGAAGGFDLSLVDPGDMEDVELVYGIAPSSLVGPDTIGGAINVRTLEPSQQSRSFFRFGMGSFDTGIAAAQATGTKDGVGYAIALDRLTSAGDVNANGTGSNWQSGSGLFKLRHALAGGRGFVQAEMLDQATNKDVSASLSSIDPDGTFNSFAGSGVQSHQSLYALDLQLPAGPASLTFRHSNEIESQSVTGPAQNVSEWYFNYRDALMDDSLQYDLPAGRGTLTAKYDLASESLFAPYTLGGVHDSSVRRLDDAAAQDAFSSFDTSALERTLALRYLLDPTTHLHYSAAIYDSWYSTFGHSDDPRFGFVWTPTTQTAVRFSVGTTFQAPLLTELYVPSPLPPPDANGSDSLVAIGNPNLTADRATEYDLGFEHIFGGAQQRLSVSADVYQSNLRDAIEQYVPPTTPGYTYPTNLGDVVYRGLELRAQKILPNRYRVAASYVVNSAFPLQVPPEIQNGSLVPNQQFLGTPLHRAAFEFDRTPGERGLSFGTRVVYEGSNNELNRPAFAALDVHVTQALKDFNLTLTGTNVTNVYAQSFTLNGAGVPYPGPDGPIVTNAYSLPPRSVMLSLSHEM